MRYRHDIDGLRALAVVPVVLFHAGVPFFPGGFVGVDVFFVISGFLITKLIHERLERGEFSLRSFYERRMRRILPALFAMLLVSWGVAAVLLLAPAFREFSGSLAAAALSLSNFQFWLESGYFDSAAETKPLLHTWSLAVEEQFYLLYPLLLLLLRRRAPAHLGPCLALMALASFLLSVWGSWTHAGAAFYLLPFRAWELLLGGMLAVDLVPAPKRAWLREAAAAAGIVAILVSVAGFSGEIRFPGWYALLPTLGAALLIHAGAQARTLPGRLLAWRPLRFIGWISYSVYLWHWPLMTFTRQALPRELDGLDRGVLVLASFALGWLSWRVVERPIRSGQLVVGWRGAWRAAAAVSAACLALGLFGVWSGGWPGRHSEQQRYYAQVLEKHQYHALYDMGGCFLFIKQGAADYDEQACARYPGGPPGRVNVLVYGDSFAAHLVPGLARASNVPIEVRQYTATACRPIRTDDERCAAIRQQFFQQVLPRSQADVVVIAARWAREVERLGEPELLERLQETVARIRASGRKVVLVGQSPTYSEPPPVTLARRPTAHWKRTLRLPADDHRMVNAALAAFAWELAIPYLDPYTAGCEGSRCLVAVDGVPFHWDYGHLTLDGARFYGTPLASLVLADVPPPAAPYDGP